MLAGSLSIGRKTHFKFSFSDRTVRMWISGLPWWLSGKESTCQCRRHGFDPWSGKIPHAVEQLSQRTTTIEPVLQSPGAPITEPVCCQTWSPCAREPALHNNKNHLKEVHTLQPPCFLAKSRQLCPTLCDPMDHSPAGSFVHGILQTRIMEWVAMPSSRGSSWPRDWTRVSHVS